MVENLTVFMFEKNMAKSKSFRDVIAWQRAHEYVLKVYKFTSAFPKNETFGLSSQFQRAAISVAANIAEGFRKSGDKDKMRFFNIAQGSLEECKYYEILSHDLEYGNKSDLDQVSEETSRLLYGYIKGMTNC